LGRSAIHALRFDDGRRLRTGEKLQASLAFDPSAAENTNVRANPGGNAMNSIPGTILISFESCTAISASPFSTNVAFR
jgi:hypothetical protein